jgi:hypothetical protein
MGQTKNNEVAFFVSVLHTRMYMPKIGESPTTERGEGFIPEGGYSPSTALRELSRKSGDQPNTASNGG